jgi:hypothetical protein
LDLTDYKLPLLLTFSLVFSATIMEYCFTFWAWGLYFSYNLHSVDRGMSSYQNVMIAWMADVGFRQCLVPQAPSFLPILKVFPSTAGSGVPEACVGWSIAGTAERDSNPFTSVVSIPFSSFLLQCPGYHCAFHLRE